MRERAAAGAGSVRDAVRNHPLLVLGVLVVQTRQARLYSEDEIYGLEVVVIPTNRPVRRMDDEDLLYRTKREKFAALLDEIEAER